MSGRSLRASIDQMELGTLREVDGLWRFQYAEAWLKNPRGFALSPRLPLRAEPLLDEADQRPVQWYFDNLLPAQGQRALLASGARLEATDTFGLLAWYGTESTGAVTLLAPDAKLPTKGLLLPLPDAALEARIRQLPKTPLTSDAIKRMALAGAQPKLAVVLQDDALFEPTGATPSTHILKTDHPDAAHPHAAITEWFVMRLARRLKLEVPEAQRRYVPSPVYLVECFDRELTAAGWQRRHVIDACQLLGLAPDCNYSQGSMENLAALAAACRSPAVARSRLFGWLVFNVLIGNCNVHLKNLSFFVSHEGMQLAPFYGLPSAPAPGTPAPAWPPQTTFAWPMLGVPHFSKLNRALLLEAGAELKLAKGTATRLLENLRGRIAREAEALQAEIDVENARILETRPELAKTLAAESRCLGTLRYSVINGMAQQLAS